MSTYAECNKAGVPHDARAVFANRSLVGLVGRLTETLAIWRERARQRRDLLRLSERDLRDIGIDRATAMGEASKPFWIE